MVFNAIVWQKNAWNSNKSKIKEFPTKIKEFPNKIKEFPKKIKEFSSIRNIKIKEFPNKIKEFSLIGISHKRK